MKKYILLTIPLLLLIGCAGSSETKLKDIVHTANKAKYADMGQGIQFVGALLKPNLTIENNFVVRYRTATLASAPSQKLLQRAAMRRVLYDPALQAIGEVEGTWVQNYKDTIGNALLTITLAPNDYRNAPDDLNDVFAEIEYTTELINQDLPMVLNSIEAYVHATARHPNIIEYQYVWQEVDIFEDPTILQQLKNTLIDDIRRDKASNTLCQLGASFRYAYFDKVGSPVFSLVIRPEDYNK